MIKFRQKQVSTAIFLPIILIIAVLIIFNLWTPKEAEAPKLTVNQDIAQATILLEKPITGLYPNSNNDTRDQGFNTNLFDSLLTLTNGKLETSLASSWRNLDQNTWRFTINKNAKFSNGNNLSTKDIKFSIEMAIKNNWPIPDPLKQISEVTIVDNSTVEIKTKTPLPNLLVLLSGLPIISGSQYTSKPATENALGTGGFKVTSFETKKEGDQITQQSIVLEPNPNYQGRASKVKKLVYRYLNSNEIVKLSFEDLKNNFDLIETKALPQELRDKLLTTNFSKTLIPQPSVSILILNPNEVAKQYTSASTNPFGHIRVRKAINLALSPSQIISEAKVDSRTPSQLATSVVFGFNPTLHRTATNQGDAIKMLREEGFGSGFTLNLALSQDKIAEGQAIAKELKEIGITVKLNLLNPDNEKVVAKEGNFAAYYRNWADDFFDTTYTFTSALFNRSFSNPKIAAKVSGINNSFDITGREKKLGEAMSLAMDDMIWVPVLSNATAVLVKDSFNLIPSYPFIVGSDINGK